MKNLIMKIFINTENMLCLRIKWHNHHHLSMEVSQWAGSDVMSVFYMIEVNNAKFA